MKLFQVYPKRWSGDNIQIRFWRCRLYINRQRWWGNHRLGIAIGFSGGWPQLVLELLAYQAVLYVWSCHDDCECDKCIPF